MARTPLYQEDLAYVHHVGFAEFSRGAAPGLLEMLRRADIARGRVLDLGCGGGHWLRALGDAGYETVGIDASPALVAWARREAPRARVELGSVYDATLPRCDAVTALGEVLSYLPSDTGRVPSFEHFFARVGKVLRPGGLFLFDLIVRDPRQPLGGRNWRSGPDWAVLSESREEPERGRLVREIIAFRRVRAAYRRSEETHHVRVPARDEVMDALRAAGFRARTARSYGAFPLAPRRMAFLARKLRAGQRGR